MIDFFCKSMPASNFCNERKSALRPLGHLDAVVGKYNMWYCFYSMSVTADGPKIFSSTKPKAHLNFKFSPILPYDELSIDR